MASNPLNAVRRRFARSIDWRVQTAVDQRMREFADQFSTDRSRIDEALATQRRIVDDALDTLDVKKLKFAKIGPDELDSLRTLLRELSIGIADQHLVQTELLEALDRRVRGLEATVDATRASSGG
jgi:hypothetical protein